MDRQATCRDDAKEREFRDKPPDPRPAAPIDMDRVVWDPEYREEVRAALSPNE